eukprot:SAG31_NODE_30575_length_379_cov_0.735714_1_plen_58_part_01
MLVYAEPHRSRSPQLAIGSKEDSGTRVGAGTEVGAAPGARARADRESYAIRILELYTL